MRGDAHDQPVGQPQGIEIAPGVRVREETLRFSFSSSGGPGGQNVNKRATKATLRVAIGALSLSPAQVARLVALGSFYVVGDGPAAELLIHADEHRSQERNKGECLERLRAIVVACLKAPKVRRATKPSRGSKERRITEKKRRGEIKRGRRDED